MAGGKGAGAQGDLWLQDLALTIKIYGVVALAKNAFITIKWLLRFSNLLVRTPMCRNGFLSGNKMRRIYELLIIALPKIDSLIHLRLSASDQSTKSQK